MEKEHSSWDSELTTRPLRPFTSIELFAGAGGLALGMERAGFQHLLLNEVVRDACLPSANMHVFRPSLMTGRLQGVSPRSTSKLGMLSLSTSRTLWGVPWCAY